MFRYLRPMLLTGGGLCILLSPTGQVPRAALAFGEYKQWVAMVLILTGALFAWLVKRARSKSL